MALNNTVLASTLQRRSKGYLNGVSSQIPLWHWLRKKGQYKSTNGGTQLEENLEHVLDENEPSFAGYDTLPVNEQDAVVTLVATWKNYYKSIAISGEEKRINTGQRIFNLLAQKETNAIESLTQQMNDHFYLDGTLNGGKRVTGLDASINITPTTGTLYGITRSAVVPMQNYSLDTNSEAYNTATSVSELYRDMADIRMRCGRLKAGGAGNRYPDLILCTEAYYRLYEQTSQISGQRFVNVNKVDAGFGDLMFHGATLMHDEDMPSDAGSDAQAYFINSRFMKLHYHPAANVSAGDFVNQTTQDAFAAKVLWMGELFNTLPRKHGIHLGIAAVATS